mmetsp:Transcript_34016/g.74176  ORF Transcript_34016/g.74176 Transcript_34016/m.74176 type:complete len:261 (+) Transcript_34016:288-1070(+)
MVADVFGEDLAGGFVQYTEVVVVFVPDVRVFAQQVGPLFVLFNHLVAASAEHHAVEQTFLLLFVERALEFCLLGSQKVELDFPVRKCLQEVGVFDSSRVVLGVVLGVDLRGVCFLGFLVLLVNLELVLSHFVHLVFVFGLRVQVLILLFLEVFRLRHDGFVFLQFHFFGFVRIVHTVFRHNYLFGFFVFITVGFNIILFVVIPFFFFFLFFLLFDDFHLFFLFCLGLFSLFDFVFVFLLFLPCQRSFLFKVDQGLVAHLN